MQDIAGIHVDERLEHKPPSGLINQASHREALPCFRPPATIGQLPVSFTLEMLMVVLTFRTPTVEGNRIFSDGLFA
jgi:hypothetical protein